MWLWVVARKHLVIVNEYTRGYERAIVASLLIPFDNQRHESIVSVFKAETSRVSLQCALQVLLEALDRENAKGLALLPFDSI